jgi:nitrate/nitrite-specific signal transduction histidine kinase
MGLSTMRERAQRFGGEVRIDSAPGQGTTVRVRMRQEKEGDSPVLEKQPERVEGEARG